ncbi:MAG: glycosyltransferase [Polyangiaceae bacterium]
MILVRSLQRGGAERQVVMLARSLRDAGVDVCVVVFYDGGAFERELHEAQIRLISLGKVGRWDLAPFALKLLDVMRKERPDVLYGFMSTPNLLAVTLRPLLPDACLVWGIRSSRGVDTDYDWLARWLTRLESRCARLPDLVIANSQAGANDLLRRSFPRDKIVIVPNGIDVDLYQFDQEGRDRVRREWHVQPDEILMGIVARADPVKAHGIFLEAAAVLCKQRSNLRFVCVGVGDELAAIRMRNHASELGIGDRLLVEGPRDSLASAYSAIDVLVMCSNSEGFPNVVAEAMACGTPCVVTAVGDAVDIVGDTGMHARPGDPEGIANAILAMIERLAVERRSEIRERVRARIAERFSLAQLARTTLAAFQPALRARKQPA